MTAPIHGSKATFGVLNGCWQGRKASLYLFNYYIDYVLNVAATEINKEYPDGKGR